MNYLGHSMISYEIDKRLNKRTLYGNFTGDFYKGRIESLQLPDEVKEGLALHRMIDSISDRQDNFLNELLNEKFGIFKGIVSDMYIDHFLSKNFYNIFNENINDIEKKILCNVKSQKTLFNRKFEKVFNWIFTERVLIKYGDIDFLERVFEGISGRVKKGEVLREAVKELKKNYDKFEERSVKEFHYVKNKVLENI